MDNIQFYAHPNNHGDFSQWWGKGGCELWDELDPKCQTEGPGMGPLLWLTEVGPFPMPFIGEWEAKAHAIPGYTNPDGQTAICFRQAKTEGEEPISI
jgi:hypothetical protein